MLNVTEFLIPSIYLDVDELKRVDLNLRSETGKIDVEIPAESR